MNALYIEGQQILPGQGASTTLVAPGGLPVSGAITFDGNAVSQSGNTFTFTSASAGVVSLQQGTNTPATGVITFDGAGVVQSGSTFSFSGASGGAVDSITAGDGIAVSTAPPNSVSAPLVSVVAAGNPTDIQFNVADALSADTGYLTYDPDSKIFYTENVQIGTQLDLGTYPVSIYAGNNIGSAGQVLTRNPTGATDGVLWNGIVSGNNSATDGAGNIPFVSTDNDQVLVSNHFYTIDPTSTFTADGATTTYTSRLFTQNLAAAFTLDLTNTQYVIDSQNSTGTAGQVLTKQDGVGAVWADGGGVASVVVGAGTPATGALTFEGAGVSQSGNVFTFSGGGGGGGSPGGGAQSLQFNEAGGFGGAAIFYDATETTIRSAVEANATNSIAFLQEGNNLEIDSLRGNLKLFGRYGALMVSGDNVGIVLDSGADLQIAAATGIGLYTRGGTVFNYGTAGQVLTSGGTGQPVSWTTVSGGGGSPGGAAQSLQFNEAGGFGGAALFYDATDTTIQTAVGAAGNRIKFNESVGNLHLESRLAEIILDAKDSITLVSGTNHPIVLESGADLRIAAPTGVGLFTAGGSEVVNYGTVGQVLTSGGTGQPVSWATVSATAGVSSVVVSGNPPAAGAITFAGAGVSQSGNTFTFSGGGGGGSPGGGNNSLQFNNGGSFGGAGISIISTPTGSENVLGGTDSAGRLNTISWNSIYNAQTPSQIKLETTLGDIRCVSASSLYLIGGYNPLAEGSSVIIRAPGGLGISTDLNGAAPNYGTAGQVLTSGGAGATPSWTTVSSGGTPAGATNSIQFNNSGAFGGSAVLNYTGGQSGVGLTATVVGETPDDPPVPVNWNGLLQLTDTFGLMRLVAPYNLEISSTGGGIGSFGGLYVDMNTVRLTGTNEVNLYSTNATVNIKAPLGIGIVVGSAFPNYGTAGQVLTSGGVAATANWASLPTPTSAVVAGNAPASGALTFAGTGVSQSGNVFTFTGGGASGVSSIVVGAGTPAAGAITFAGAAVSQSGSTFTFTNSPPGGTTGQVQFNNGGVFGGTQINYLNAGASRGFQTVVGIGNNTLSLITATGNNIELKSDAASVKITATTTLDLTAPTGLGIVPTGGASPTYGTTGQVLTSGGTGQPPSWSAVSAAGTTGQVQFNGLGGALGGALITYTTTSGAALQTPTGGSTNNSLLFNKTGGSGIELKSDTATLELTAASTISLTAPTGLGLVATVGGTAAYGTAGQVLTSGGTGAPPTWASPSGGIASITAGQNIAVSTTAPNSATAPEVSVSVVAGSSTTVGGGIVFEDVPNTNILTSYADLARVLPSEAVSINGSSGTVSGFLDAKNVRVNEVLIPFSIADTDLSTGTAGQVLTAIGGAPPTNGNWKWTTPPFPVCVVPSTSGGNISSDVYNATTIMTTTCVFEKQHVIACSVDTNFNNYTQPSENTLIVFVYATSSLDSGFSKIQSATALIPFQPVGAPPFGSSAGITVVFNGFLYNSAVDTLTPGTVITYTVKVATSLASTTQAPTWSAPNTSIVITPY